MRYCHSRTAVQPPLGQDVAPADQGAANDKLNAVVDAWLDTFVKGKKFVGGDALTIADFKAVPFLICLSHKALARRNPMPRGPEAVAKLTQLRSSLAAARSR